MRVKLLFILICCLGFVPLLQAQLDYNFFDWYESRSDSTGKVTIHQNENIESVFIMHLDDYKKENHNNGFRILIFADLGQNARSEAEKTRSKFIRIFGDEIYCKAKFDSPRWKVYVGEARTLSEILNLYKRVRTVFKDPSIVPDNISQ